MSLIFLLVFILFFYYCIRCANTTQSSVTTFTHHTSIDIEFPLAMSVASNLANLNALFRHHRCQRFVHLLQRMVHHFVLGMCDETQPQKRGHRVDDRKHEGEGHKEGKQEPDQGGVHDQFHEPFHQGIFPNRCLQQRIFRSMRGGEQLFVRHQLPVQCTQAPVQRLHLLSLVTFRVGLFMMLEMMLQRH